MIRHSSSLTPGTTVWLEPRTLLAAPICHQRARVKVKRAVDHVYVTVTDEAGVDHQVHVDNILRHDPSRSRTPKPAGNKPKPRMDGAEELPLF
jgi:hypothetical protein